MNYFTFDGIDSRDYNTYIATSNAFDAPGREDEVIKVPGSNNIYYLTEGTYKPFDIKLYCYIPSNMQVKTDDLRNFLLSKGTCTYTEAIRPGEFRVARFIEAYEIDVSDRVSAAFVLTFKAQPQRYLTTNTPITTTATADTTTDTTMSLSTVPTPINISLNGNTTQEGSSGKNLIPRPYYQADGTYQGVTWTTDNMGKITASGTTTAGTNFLLTNNSSFSLRAGTYTLSVTGTLIGVDLKIYNGSDILATIANGSVNGKITFTLSTAQNIRTYFNTGYSNVSVNFSVYVQLEKGSTATAYEPHISPTNPQVIHNVSGDNKVIIASKNLLSNDWENDWQRGYWDISTGKFVSSRNWQAIKYYIPVQPNTTYYVYADPNISASIGNICQYDANKNFIIYKAGTKNTTFTTSANVYFLTIYVGNPYKDTNISLSKSDTTTNGTYVPFTNQSYPLNLGSIELNKIGTYQDYIYKNGGKWYVHKATASVDMGTLTYQTDNGGVYFYSSVSGKGRTNFDLLCTCYTVTTSTNTSGMTDYQVKGQTSGSYIFIKDSRYTSPTDLKTALSGETLKYNLATPTNTEITDTTLINQLNNIEKAYSYNGTTNILQVSNDNGFMLSVLSLHANNVSSTYKGEPIITVNSTGLIYFNGCVIKVNQAPMTINSQTMQAYNGTVNLNNYIEANDFPMIEVGTNVIGSEMPLSIVPNYWKL